jgi:hypothetical protein
VAAQWESANVRGIRVAQHGLDPLVARVVIDLPHTIAYRVDVRRREAGTVVVVLGVENAGADAPPDPAERSPERRRYLAQVAGTLARMQALRKMIASIDGQITVVSADLPGAAAELGELEASLTAMKVPVSLATTHDLLIRTCALGARAARMRRDADASGDAAAALNAASAAAGALIMFDRATRDLGYASPQ